MWKSLHEEWDQTNKQRKRMTEPGQYPVRPQIQPEAGQAETITYANQVLFFLSYVKLDFSYLQSKDS